MHGNVWEWYQDWYSENYYRNSPSIDPLGPERGQNRVIRGGSFRFTAPLVRSAVRAQDTPVHCSSAIGARLVRLSPSTPTG